MWYFIFQGVCVDGLSSSYFSIDMCVSLFYSVDRGVISGVSFQGDVWLGVFG